MDTHVLSINIQNIEIGDELDEGYRPVSINTQRGLVHARYYHAPGEKACVVYVGGAEDGWDSPANNVYPLLCQELQLHQISGLRVKLRYPNNIHESMYDILTATAFLENLGIKKIGLVGHSIGGAVVIRAAAASGDIQTIVTLASQSYGADAAAELPKDSSLLLIHGSEDEILPPYCSTYIHELAPVLDKDIILHEGAHHGLEEVAEKVHQEVAAWLIQKLT